jgi:hypothetical protein
VVDAEQMVVNDALDQIEHAPASKRCAEQQSPGPERVPLPARAEQQRAAPNREQIRAQMK